jgi:hypothetical protein
MSALYYLRVRASCSQLHSPGEEFAPAEHLVPPRVGREVLARRAAERLAFQRQMHALVPAVLLRMARFDALDLNSQSQPVARD